MKRLVILLLIALSIVSWGHRRRRPRPELLLLDKTRQAATLVGGKQDWNLTFDAAGKTRTVAAADLQRWGQPRDPKQVILVLLIDGGILGAQSIAADREKLHLDSPLFGEFDLPLDIVTGVLLAPPIAPLDRDQMLDRLAAPDAGRYRPPALGQR